MTSGRFPPRAFLSVANLFIFTLNFVIVAANLCIFDNYYTKIMKIAIFAREIDAAWRDRLCYIFKALEGKGILLCYYKPFYEKVREEYRMKVPHGETFSNHSELP